MTGMITDAQLVEQYQKLAAVVTAREAQLADELKPYKDGMEIIKNAFLARFQERGSTNSKTEFGTPYLSRIMNTKVVDRNLVLEFCQEHWQGIGADMLQVGVTKDAVKQWLEVNPETDPKTIGIEVSFINRVNMPRS